ncbi:hypothetical protein [Azospirillum soli]|uniref:hypothetical protein n=1 Tax=Azospirillum soli TaxID=1304799 RepID=UPI001AE9AF06|nr:hypothetical protein [Azospirillum soli]MBP2313456.1 hypothetical protein [Azospirillum soli]
MNLPSRIGVGPKIYGVVVLLSVVAIAVAVLLLRDPSALTPPVKAIGDISVALDANGADLRKLAPPRHQATVDRMLDGLVKIRNLLPPKRACVRFRFTWPHMPALSGCLWHPPAAKE